jgi:hypothetical protein
MRPITIAIAGSNRSLKINGRTAAGSGTGFAAGVAMFGICRILRQLFADLMGGDPKPNGSFLKKGGLTGLAVAVVVGVACALQRRPAFISEGELYHK